MAWAAAPGAKDALFHITAANCDHRCITEKSLQRMGAFGNELMNALTASDDKCIAWCVLPNHYHLLVTVTDLHRTVKRLGQMH
jgi:REP element-mobilizing transposase RayT